MAISTSLDAAGDGLPTCEDHQRPGWFDDRGPYPRAYAETAQNLIKFISCI